MVLLIRFDEHLVPLLTDHEPSPHPFNPNMGDVDEIASSVLLNGCYSPVYVSRRSDLIVKGHHLYLALRELGATRWPIAWREGLSREDEIRMMLADNKIAKMSVLDRRMEVEALRQLALSDAGIQGTGYRDFELERMAEKVLADDLTPLDFSAKDSGHILPREDTCPVCGALRRERRG